MKDLPEGTTHFYNDGCGEPENNEKCNALIHASGLWCANPKVGCPLHDPVAKAKTLADFEASQDISKKFYRNGYLNALADVKEVIEQWRDTTDGINDLLKILDTLKA